MGAPKISEFANNANDDGTPVSSADFVIYEASTIENPLAHASPMARFFASVIDYQLMGIIFAIAATLAVALRSSTMLVLLLPAIVIVPYLYFSIAEGVFQTTLGKYFLGIRVSRSDGAPIGVGRALLRNISKAIAAGPFLIGYAIAFITQRRQALHDFFVDTVVVEVPDAAPMKALAAAFILIAALYLSFAGIKLSSSALKTIAAAAAPAPNK